MQEAFLHYVWKHQYFDKSALATSDGQNLIIFTTGFHNSDAGPDFKEARIKIDDIEWSGSVELHVKSSNWYDHEHQNDVAYEDVILHVVWENDKEVQRKDGSVIPVVELKSKVDLNLVTRYKSLIQSNGIGIPCEDSFANVEEITKFSMLDKLLVERLKLKSSEILSILKSTNGDWEETAYRCLFQSFGLKVNKEPFGNLAKELPFRLIKKHNQSIEDIEALLFGTAGFLNEASDDLYFKELKTRFNFLSNKYQLDPSLNTAHWKFLRLRPANFPTIRLGQLAAILKDTQSIFQEFINTSDIEQLVKWLRTTPGVYWQSHYHFNKKSKTKNSGIGKSTFDLIVINTIAPLLVAYGQTVDDYHFTERAVTLLEELKPESNRLTKVYSDLGLKPKNAADSQGMIQLYNHYCTKRKCLSCSIGHSILAEA
ncbi:DUF2851 family protein [Fulvivirga lutea]|uniref:DUF2851 family protein n=1 Tax=Fulvivirga lutea TaxID=2810512 RepID=A0A974WH71_9BACT|nr:DUF2851 family protein [Fulvivirga lutea]QSE97643.1 DUF2851 family protein [Fulvivirga lutea]